jgi:hypothetical protein
VLSELLKGFTHEAHKREQRIARILELESATDRCEDVANIIEGVVLENA